MAEKSNIPEFFRDRSVFITGVTGFLGKVLLKKLLQSCSAVNTVYVLMRAKDAETPRQRLDNFLSCQVFSTIHHDLLKRVVPIEGDIGLTDLGMSQSDRQMLAKHVSVVFHSAATVRFDEPLRKSVELNLLGTQRVIQLCQSMVKLAALVHVSTAYAYCNRMDIDELIYPEKLSPQKIIQLTECLDDDLLEEILPKILDGRPTTYHYSKALAEHILQETDLPVAIVRPSIITAAHKEPMPGWVDGLNGPTTFIIMTGRGLLRTMMVYEGTSVDWVPVDLVVNLLLTAAWNIGTNRASGPQIYNCTSCDLNKITWNDIERTAFPLVVSYPIPKFVRYPGGSFKASHFMNACSVFFEHKLPAIILDGIARLFGKKAELTLMVKRMERAAGILQYFTTQEWKFRCNRLLALQEQQSPEDRKEFSFDIRPIEWTPYLKNYVLGVRRYILKEPDSTLPVARHRLKCLWWLEHGARALLILGFVWILIKKTSLPHHILWALISLSFHIMARLPKSWRRKIGSWTGM